MLAVLGKWERESGISKLKTGCIVTATERVLFCYFHCLLQTGWGWGVPWSRIEVYLSSRRAHLTAAEQGWICLCLAGSLQFGDKCGNGQVRGYSHYRVVGEENSVALQCALSPGKRKFCSFTVFTLTVLLFIFTDRTPYCHHHSRWQNHCHRWWARQHRVCGRRRPYPHRLLALGHSSP